MLHHSIVVYRVLAFLALLCQCSSHTHRVVLVKRHLDRVLRSVRSCGLEDCPAFPVFRVFRVVFVHEKRTLACEPTRNWRKNKQSTKRVNKWLVTDGTVLTVVRAAIASCSSFEICSMATTLSSQPRLSHSSIRAFIRPSWSSVIRCCLMAWREMYVSTTSSTLSVFGKPCEACLNAHLPYPGCAHSRLQMAQSTACCDAPVPTNCAQGILCGSRVR